MSTENTFLSTNTRRIALGVEYVGQSFRGWQVQQPGVVTVQGCLEKALSKVANHPITVICAGRTDAGVHGIGQVVHFDTIAVREARSWVMGSNANLPDSIAIRWVQPVPIEFHARFSALARRYRYIIVNRPFRSALTAKRATWHYHRLDADKMRQAAQVLIGEHDFSAYRAQGCQSRTPMRSIYALDIERRGDFIVLEVEANGFLHHMVRNIAGVLMAIGQGERPVDWAAEVLASRNRTCGGVTASPDGLYFLHVRYPRVYNLPNHNRIPALDLL